MVKLEEENGMLSFKRLLLRANRYFIGLPTTNKKTGNGKHYAKSNALESDYFSLCWKNK